MSQYGCYRCGTMEGEVRFSDRLDDYVCDACGAAGAVVTFLQALDLLNDAYLHGYIVPPVDPDDLEEALEEMEEEGC